MKCKLCRSMHNSFWYLLYHGRILIHIFSFKHFANTAPGVPPVTVWLSRDVCLFVCLWD